MNRILFLRSSRDHRRRLVRVVGRRSAALVAMAIALAFAACHRGPAVSAPRSAVEPAARYNANRGLKLTATSAAFVGLATAEVSASRVPAEAVLRTVQGTFVYVDNGGWFLRTRVTPGPVDAPPRDGSSIPIADGLYDGDRIVTQGVRALWLAELHFLRAGQACAHEG